MTELGEGWAKKKKKERERAKPMNGRFHKAPSLLLVCGMTSQWDRCHLPASGGESVHS